MGERWGSSGEASEDGKVGDGRVATFNVRLGLCRCIAASIEQRSLALQHTHRVLPVVPLTAGPTALSSVMASSSSMMSALANSSAAASTATALNLLSNQENLSKIKEMLPVSEVLRRACPSGERVPVVHVSLHSTRLSLSLFLLCFSFCRATLRLALTCCSAC